MCERKTNYVFSSTYSEILDYLKNWTGRVHFPQVLGLTVAFNFMCRVSKDYYAPALGGIMLSIGVQLSVSDFALVLKRYGLFEIDRSFQN